MYIEQVKHKGQTIYKHFFAPGLEYYYPTLWGRYSCTSLEEAYRKKQELLAGARKENQACKEIVQNFNKKVIGR